MKRLLNMHYMVSLHLLILAVIITVAAYVVHASQNDVRLQLLNNIDRQTALIAELATATDRNGADAIGESIVKDCPNRGEFESLLIRLGNLNDRDLLKTQQLFESCGGFYPERKALMVSRLEREYQILADNVELLDILDEKENIHVQKLQDWSALIALETQRSDLLTEQTEIQRKIIIALIEGENVNSKNITEFVSRAQKIGELLGVVDKQIDAIRGRLVM